MLSRTEPTAPTTDESITVNTVNDGPAMILDYGYRNSEDVSDSDTRTVSGTPGQCVAEWHKYMRRTFDTASGTGPSFDGATCERVMFETYEIIAQFTHLLVDEFREIKVTDRDYGDEITFYVHRVA